MSFNKIIGQDLALRALRVDLAKGNLCGAYLFTGPPGVGKKMAAISFAQALNCKEGGVDGCGSCSSCLRIERMNHPNLRIVNPEGSFIKIEQVRQLKTEARYKIYQGKKRVWILNEAEKLTLEAANSLLKILEEPSPNLIIILITHIPHLLLPTILSRCRVVRFFPLSHHHIKELLRREDIPLHLIALISELTRGSMSEALNLIKEEDIFMERQRAFRLIKRGKSALQEVFELSERWSAQQNSNLQILLHMVMFFLRDLLLLKMGVPTSVLNQDKVDELISLKDKYSFIQLLRGIDGIEKTKSFLQANVSPHLALEGMWMRILSPVSYSKGSNSYSRLPRPDC